jgi:hypothetical protein
MGAGEYLRGTFLSGTWRRRWRRDFCLDFSAPNFGLQTTLRFKVGLCSNKKSANFLRSALRGWVPGTLSCGYMAFKFRFESINPIN